MQDVMTFISQHSLLALGIAIIFVLLLIIEMMRAKQNLKQLTPQQAVQLINHQHANILDIRPNESYRQGHIIDAQSVTVKDLEENNKKIEKYKTKPVIIVCPTGSESQKVAAFMIKHGYNAYSIAGGLRAWNEAQLPLIKE